MANARSPSGESWHAQYSTVLDSTDLSPAQVCVAADSVMRSINQGKMEHVHADSDPPLQTACSRDTLLDGK